MTNQRLRVVGGVSQLVTNSFNKSINKHEWKNNGDGIGPKEFYDS